MPFELHFFISELLRCDAMHHIVCDAMHHILCDA